MEDRSKKHPSYIQFNYTFVHYGDKFLETQSVQSVCMPLLWNCYLSLVQTSAEAPTRERFFDHSLPQAWLDQ